MRLLDFVVCDDIRREMGEKVSLMGVFADSITVQVPKGAPRPIPLRLALFFRVLVDETDPLPDHFKVVVKAGADQIMSVEGGVSTAGRPRVLQLPLTFGALPIAGDTSLSFGIIFSTGDRRLLDTAPALGIAVRVVEQATLRISGPEEPPVRG